MAEECAIHAYVLMTNHVHLLMTPQQSGSVARVMQGLGRRYVRYINDRYHRTGTLWEGRYKACPVDGERYLLCCHRYIDLNPVRAAMVANPADYEWSSFRANALGEYDPLVRAHDCYRALASTSRERCDAYRAIVMEATDDEDTNAIRLHLQRQHAFGGQRFRAAIEAQLGRRAGPARIGRPPKAKHPPESAR